MRLKKRFPAFSWKHLQRSLLLRMGGAIAAIALLAVLGMSVSGLVAESTQGSGEAINRAGSLRMQSWSMASLYLAVPLPPASAAAQRMADAIRGFDATLNSPTHAGHAAAQRRYASGRDLPANPMGMAARVRPRFQAVADGGLPRLDARQRAQLLDDMRRSSTRSMTWSSRWKTPPKPRSWSCAWCWAWH
jgi:hypothetical protein